MKKLSKIVFVIIIVLSFIYLLFSLYQNNILNQLNKKENLVNKKWIEIYNNTEKRNLLIRKICQTIENKELKQIYITIETNFKNREYYKNNCSVEFVKLEHDVNENYVDFVEKYKCDTSFTKNRINSLINKINEEDSSLNKNVEKYNDDVLNYNKYFSVFPNFIIAKKNGFSRKKFFSIEYGIKNIDPIEKNKEIPEWAKGQEL